MANGHGGARPGAGRKPKELRYWAVAQDVEDRIAWALPAVIEKIISMARDGDLAAARYLCDRILGRTALLPAAPAWDRQAPYTDQDHAYFAESDRPHEESEDELRDSIRFTARLEDDESFLHTVPFERDHQRSSLDSEDAYEDETEQKDPTPSVKSPGQRFPDDLLNTKPMPSRPRDRIDPARRDTVSAFGPHIRSPDCAA